MGNSHTTVDLSAPERDRSFGNIALLLLLVSVAILFVYICSPILVAVFIGLGMEPPPPWMETMRVFWTPLKWYAQSDIPGGKEYNEFVNWLATN